MNSGGVKYFGSYVLWIRPMVPEVVPSFYDVLITIDGDTLVLDEISKLINKTYHMSEEKVVIMARNSDNDRIRKKYGLRPEDISVNPGVMCINMKNWKKHRCTERLLSFMEHHDITKYKTLDEVAYSKVLKKEICAADFNEIYYPCYRDLTGRQLLFMYHFNPEHYYSIQEIEKAKGHEVILHYVNLLGHPWEKGCLCPLSGLWEQYYKRAWKRETNKVNPVKKGACRKVILVSYRNFRWLYVFIYRVWYGLVPYFNIDGRNDGIK